MEYWNEIEDNMVTYHITEGKPVEDWLTIDNALVDLQDRKRIVSLTETYKINVPIIDYYDLSPYMRLFIHLVTRVEQEKEYANKIKSIKSQSKTYNANQANSILHKLIERTEMFCRLMDSHLLNSIVFYRAKLSGIHLVTREEAIIYNIFRKKEIKELNYA